MITPTSRRALTALTALCILAPGCEPDKKAPPEADPTTSPAQTAAQGEPAAAEKEAPEAEAKAPVTSVYKAPQGNPVVGFTSPEDVREKHAKWRESYEKTKAHADAKTHLGGGEAGAELTVIFGTWCDDCMREVPQLWRDLEALGDASTLKLYYVGVDDAFGSGEADLSAYRPDAIPTFVVSRNGKEVGRVIERPETTLSNDLGRLIRGEATGVISGSPDLRVSDPARDAPPPPLPTAP
jgi:thiol-disulfide isomerase/thioredoxin